MTADDSIKCRCANSGMTGQVGGFQNRGVYLKAFPSARSRFVSSRFVSFSCSLKLHENALYAGYPHPWQEGTTVFYRSVKMKDLYNASITSIGTKRLILLSAPVLTYAFFSWLEICSIKFNMLSSSTPRILIEGSLFMPEKVCSKLSQNRSRKDQSEGFSSWCCLSTNSLHRTTPTGGWDPGSKQIAGQWARHLIHTESCHQRIISKTRPWT